MSKIRKFKINPLTMEEGDTLTVCLAGKDITKVCFTKKRIFNMVTVQDTAKEFIVKLLKN